MHIPVNHHLRPVYRALSLATGAYLLVYGAVGFAQTSGAEMFTQDDAEWVLGLRTNPGFALLSAITGLVVLLANLVGRNIDHFANLAVASAYAVLGTAILCVMQTDLNVFASSMVNVIMIYIVSIVLGTAGLYDKIGSAEHAAAEEKFRAGVR